jgi:hypothetical protein
MNSVDGVTGWIYQKNCDSTHEGLDVGIENLYPPGRGVIGAGRVRAVVGADLFALCGSLHEAGRIRARPV